MRPNMLNPKKQVKFEVREGIVKDHIVLASSIQLEKCGWVCRNLCETNALYSLGHWATKVKGQWEEWPRICLPPVLAHTCLQSISLLQWISESIAPLVVVTEPGSLSEPIPGTAWYKLRHIDHWALSTSGKPLHIKHWSPFLEMLFSHTNES